MGTELYTRLSRGSWLIAIFVLFGSIVLKVSAQVPREHLHPALARVDSILAAGLQDQHIPGLSVSIVLDQEALLEKGYGYENVGKQVPATSGTVYRVMSVTKLFTATMLMQLRDAGKVRLDEPITTYVPEFSIRSRFQDTRPPTLRQLVSHTAGLPKDVNPGGERSFDDLVRCLHESELVIPPFSEFKYSNAGMALLGGALARAAGEPYDRYVEQQILGRLGMTRSGFTTTPVLMAHLAIPYRYEPDGTFSPLPSSDFDAYMCPAGGLLASVEDMARFIRMQFDESGGVLGATSLREMRAPLFMDPDWQNVIATGWWLRRVGAETVAWHGGQGIGFVTAVMIVPELKLGIALFANGAADVTGLSIAALEVLAPEVRRLQGQEEVDPIADVAPADYEQYTGHYILQDLAEFEIRVEAGKLVSRSLLGPELPKIIYVRAGKDRYRMKGGPFAGEMLVFEKDPTGRVIAIRQGPYTFTRKQ